MTTITVRKQSLSKKLFLTAGGGALVALAVAVGLASWQYRGHGATSHNEAVSHSRATALTSEAGAYPVTDQEQYQQWLAGKPAAARTPSAPMTAGSVTRGGDDATLYIVATDEEAARLWEAISIAPDRSLYQVMVLDSAPNSTELSLVYGTYETQRSSGLPPVRIIDTRGQ